MSGFRRSRFVARLARTEADLRAAQELRFRSFIAGRGAAEDSARSSGLDADEFDPICQHMLVEDSRSGDLVCCFRFLPLAGGQEIGRSYSAKYYDLAGLGSFDGPMLEMGRFCVDPTWRDPDILRTAWAAMTGYVDSHEVEMLFGCSSFHGTEAEEYHDAFALLAERHIAPKRWLPRVKAPKVFRFASRLKLRKPDLKLAMKRMPPLLRTYLSMGGWVSDHAVIDNDLNTLHVFTGVEIRAVPKRRAQRLRMLTG
ncbi:MAG: GNAT family N-acyltransferase [Pseudomonadota bacterium]